MKWVNYLGPLSLYIVAISFSFGQDQKKKLVVGKITDGYGKGLVGVTITIKGTNQGTITDENGKYQMELSENSEAIVASYVGFESIEKKLPSNKEDRMVLNFSIGTDDIKLFGWCCTDHTTQTTPSGPHCGNDQNKLIEKFGCTTFKRDN